MSMKKISPALIGIASLLFVCVALFAFLPQKARTDEYEVISVPTLPDAGKAEAIINTQKPEVTLSRWDGEAQITVSYQNVDARAERRAESDMFAWPSSPESVHAYPIEASPEIRDGGFEFETVLHEKPASNVFDFAIESAQPMEFTYQPPLNEEFKNNNVSPKAVSCTETECFNAEGEVVTSRPENVVGSYAVYAKGFKHHELGGLNYGVGKMFHIYRPKAIAADGEWVWATLKHQEGIISVTVPQDFLDTAAYPVIVDPTYGYTSLGASEDNTNDCILYYTPGAFTGTTGSTLSSAHWYGRGDTSTSETIWVALYDNGGATAKTRLDLVSDTLALTTTKTSYEISGGSYSLTNGTTYWLAVSSNYGIGWKNEYDSGGATNARYACSFATTPPAISNDDGTWSNNQVSFYFDYTAPASVPDAPTNLITTSVTGAISLTWTAPASSGSSNLETYGIWRGTSPFSATTSASLIASIATTSTSYSDASAVHGIVYYYRVTATNSTATSSLSNQRMSNTNSGRIIRLGGLRLR